MTQEGSDIKIKQEITQQKPKVMTDRKEEETHLGGRAMRNVVSPFAAELCHTVNKCLSGNVLPTLLAHCRLMDRRGIKADSLQTLALRQKASGRIE